MHRILNAILPVLLLAGAAGAATLYVYPDGSGTYATIADAISAGSSGDVIRLMPGTFSGTGNRDLYNERNLTITAHRGLGTVIIDCGGSAGTPHRFFEFDSATTVVQGLIVTGGYATNGGVMTIVDSDITLQDCDFRDNAASDEGGALHLSGGAQVTLDGCVFDGNRAEGSGGAVHVEGGADLTAVDCTFVLNGAPDGGHLYFMAASTATIDNSLLVWSHEGAAVSDYYGGTVTASCTDVYGNRGGNWAYTLVGQGVSNSNLSVDPLLIDPLADDYAPRSDSPVLSASCGAMGARAGEAAGQVAYGLRLDGRGQYATIQDALDGIPAGEAIVLEDGTWVGTGNEMLDPGGKALTLRSRGGDPEACILSTSAAAPVMSRVLTLDDNEGDDTVFADLTFSDGWVVGYGGLVLIDGAVGAGFENCVFRDGSATFGGAVATTNMDLSAATASFTECRFLSSFHAERWTPALIDCEFEGIYARTTLENPIAGEISGCTFTNVQSATDGGALHVTGGAGTLAFVDCDFTGCTAPDEDGRGGAVYTADASTVSFTGCAFSDNGAGDDGGDIASDNADDTPVLVLDDCTFETAGVIPESHGGSIYVYHGVLTGTACSWSDYGESNTRIAGGVVYMAYCEATFDDCRFENNTGNMGGAISTYRGTLALIDCLFLGNTARSIAGAIELKSTDADIERTDFIGNVSGVSGGAVVMASVGPEYHVDFDEVVMYDNEAETGGAALSMSSATMSARMNQCTIHGNRIADPEGAGGQIRVSDYIRLDLYHTLVTGSATAALSHYDTIQDEPVVTAYCSDIWGNAGGDWTGLLAYWADRDENMSVSPVYCSGSTGDLTLFWDSPCLPDNNACGTWLGARDEGCGDGATEAEPVVMAAAAMTSVHPNPFNPRTTVAYELPRDAAVRLTVHDARGRALRTLVEGAQAAGSYEAVWDGCDESGRRLCSGVYLMRLEAAGVVEVRRVALVK